MMQDALDQLLALTEKQLSSLHEALEPHRGALAETPSGKEAADMLALAWLSVFRTQNERRSTTAPAEGDTGLLTAIERMRGQER